jgi:hypothetical protein
VDNFIVKRWAVYIIGAVLNNNSIPIGKVLSNRRTIEGRHRQTSPALIAIDPGLIGMDLPNRIRV